MSNCMGLQGSNLASILMNKAELQEVEKLIQIIPSEILIILKDAAAQDGRSIDEEVTLRLLTTFINPNSFGFSANFDTIMNSKFTEANARAESEARQKGWMYVYQKEKLRLYVEFEGKLPKKFKENFVLDNFEEELQKMRVEVRAEKN